MKRIAFALALTLALALALPCGPALAQTQQNLATLQTAGESYQVGITWSAWSAASAASSSPFNVAGVHYFTLSWSSSGSFSGCAVTLDGNPGSGTFTAGSLIPSQTCTSSGSITVSLAANSYQAKLTPTITGTGTVIFTVTGYDVLPPSGAPIGIGASKSAFIAPSTGTTTQIVALAAGKTIYVLAWYMGNGSTAQTVTFQSGTGSACGTGTAALTPAVPLPANTAAVTMGTGVAQLFNAGAGNALCATTTASSATPIFVTYEQF